MDSLPADFLLSPISDIKVDKIDFAAQGMPGYYNDAYAVILDNVLTVDECNMLVKAAESTTNGKWERAMINIGGGMQRLIEDERCCGRIIWDQQEIIDRVWRRIEKLDVVLEILRLENRSKIVGNEPSKRKEVWKLSRPNERMRFLKYVGGEYFRPHQDGTYETPDRKERSYFTLHVYPNTGDAAKSASSSLSGPASMATGEPRLVGGATTFYSYNMKKRLNVVPVTGRILLFQHRDLLHSGDDVLQGVKYTIRTDLIYKLEAKDAD